MNLGLKKVYCLCRERVREGREKEVKGREVFESFVHSGDLRENRGRREGKRRIEKEGEKKKKTKTKNKKPKKPEACILLLSRLSERTLGKG